MPIKVSNDHMRLEINGTIVATAIEYSEGWWKVTNWPLLVRRDQAITALTVTELLENGYDNSDPVVAALRSERQS